MQRLQNVLQQYRIRGSLVMNRLAVSPLGTPVTQIVGFWACGYKCGREFVGRTPGFRHHARSGALVAEAEIETAFRKRTLRTGGAED